MLWFMEQAKIVVVGVFFLYLYYVLNSNSGHKVQARLQRDNSEVQPDLKGYTNLT